MYTNRAFLDQVLPSMVYDQDPQRAYRAKTIDWLSIFTANSSESEPECFFLATMSSL